MEYQKETTHISCNGRQYTFNERGWFLYFGCEWIRSSKTDAWLTKYLTPVIHIDGYHSHSQTEQDPNGIGQHDNGAKLDAGKPMAGRLLGMFGGALMAVSEVGTFGAKKYTEGGWQHVEDGFKRYDDAGMRHFLKRGMGEEFDEDSELPHLAHEAWNALAKLELYLREKKEK
ncbi:endolysin [Vibrio phage K121]